MSTVLYTDVGKVVRALAFQSPEIIAGSTALTVGSTQITVNQNIPSLWQVGDTLAVSANSDANFETVTITAIPSTTQMNITALTKNHALGAPVVNVTAVTPYVSAASRWFDTNTFFSAGFAYEQVTDRKTAYLDNEGFIVVPLSKPMVDINDVMDVQFQTNPLADHIELDISKAWIEDGYFLRIAAARPFNTKRGLVTVIYNGGFNPVPDDIVQAVTVMAARMYKERDSGYSDVIASAETGLMQYKKAAPADVQVVINKYRRWTE